MNWFFSDKVSFPEFKIGLSYHVKMVKKRVIWHAGRQLKPYELFLIKVVSTGRVAQGVDMWQRFIVERRWGPRNKTGGPPPGHVETTWLFALSHTPYRPRDKLGEIRNTSEKSLKSLPRDDKSTDSLACLFFPAAD